MQCRVHLTAAFPLAYLGCWHLLTVVTSAATNVRVQFFGAHVEVQLLGYLLTLVNYEDSPSHFPMLQ